jgi:hypothetical protein
MDDLLDGFIARANQQSASVKARNWDLRVPIEEIDPTQFVEDEPAVAEHTAPPAVVAAVET